MAPLSVYYLPGGEEVIGLKNRLWLHRKQEIRRMSGVEIIPCGKDLPPKRPLSDKFLQRNCQRRVHCKNQAEERKLVR